MPKKLSDLTKEEQALARKAFKKNSKLDPRTRANIAKLIGKRTKLLNKLADL